MSEYDVIVIGMGPGGEDVASELAESGLDVLAVEKELVGGECPYWGCVPSKMMIRAADLLAEARRVPGMAGESTVRPDWGPVARRIRDVATDNWDDTAAVERFEKKGGHLARGVGRIEGPGRVSVGPETHTARRGIVIATGTSPAIPPIPGLKEVPYWTNREAIEAERPPATMTVLGGGAIGLELAQAYARFGVKVTIVEALPRILSLEEPEASEVLTDVLEREGIGLRVGARAACVERQGEEIVVTLDGGEHVAGERLLVATGRRANLQGLGLDRVGIDESQHSIQVDAHMRAGDGLWAVGDVTGHGAFTHVAVYQGRIAAADILGRQDPGADYHALPRVTFTDPEVGAAGLTEEGARKQGIRVRTGVAQVPKSARGWIHGPGNEGIIKLVEDADRGVLLGATSCGPRGGEVLSMLALAVQAAIPTESLRHMIYAYPTVYRGIEDALRDLAVAEEKAPAAVG